jgi:hypothetical protein
MDLQPAELLGLPALDAKLDVAAMRYTLVLLAAVWAWLAYRGRGWGALAGGVLFVSVAIGFWVLCLGRPYGLFVDAAATRWAAQASVVATTGEAQEAFVSGEACGPLWRLVPTLGLSLGGLLLARTLAPLAALLGVAVAIQLLWGQRPDRIVAVFLWLVFSTGDLEALRGFGFLDRAWSRPGSCLAFVGLVVAILAVGRVAERVRGLGPAALALACGWMLVPAHGRLAPFWEHGLLLTLDQVPWIVLAFWGLRRQTDVACRAMIVGGGLTVAAAGAGFLVDVWGGLALYRLGLLLAAAPVVRELAGIVAGRLVRHRRLRSLKTEGLAVGLLVLLLAPCSFIAWWDPLRSDHVAAASMEPISTNVARVMEWIRQQTRADRVFVAGEDYAPVVAVLGGRRVLRAPSLIETADWQRRVRAERKAVSGDDLGRLAQLYGLGYVLATPGDFRDDGVRYPTDLEDRGLRLLHAGPGDLQVYAIRR